MRVSGRVGVGGQWGSGAGEGQRPVGVGDR